MAWTRKLQRTVQQASAEWLTCAWRALIFPVVDGEEPALQNDNRKKMRG
jgi:hypothetical protein